MVLSVRAFSLPRVCEMSNSHQSMVFFQVSVAKEQRPAIVPQDTRRSVQTALLDLSSGIGPVRFATIAHIELLVVPPELKTAKRPKLIAPQPENIAGIEQLFYLRFVFYTDFLHCSILPEKVSAVAANILAFTNKRHLTHMR